MTISLEDLKATGAKVMGLDIHMLTSLNKVEENIVKHSGRIVLLKNGLNSGKHSSKLHPKGKAVDFVVIGELKPWDIVVEMIRAGFNGIGVYWNGSVYSYHGDIREGNGQWFCRINGKARDYVGLIQTL